jgi:hypothetical protein
MASGFQNNNSQLTPNYYRVTIDTSSWSTTATSNASGGVEAWDYNYFTTLNTTLNNSIRRARGNIRFNSILSQLATGDNPEILDMTVMKTGPTAETAADNTAVSVTFTVGYPREAGVVGAWQSIIGTGTLSDGSTTLTTSTYDSLSASDAATAVQNSIKEAVVRGITIGGSSGYTRQYRTYDATAVQQYQSNVTVTQPDTPANVWTKVTVSIIDTMTQQTS